MTCRMAKNVPPGTKVHVSMRAKYTHLQDPKAGGGEAVEVWAKETLVWEEEVPASGSVQAKHFVFTFDRALPPPPPGTSGGIVFLTEWKAVHVSPVNGSKEEAGEVAFTVPKPTKPSDWNRSLTVRKDRNGEGGLALALYPPSSTGPPRDGNIRSFRAFPPRHLLQGRIPLKKLVETLASLKLAVILLVVLLVGLSAGTILESRTDAATAGRLVYYSWWFLGLQGLFAINVACSHREPLPVGEEADRLRRHARLAPPDLRGRGADLLRQGGGAARPLGRGERGGRRSSTTLRGRSSPVTSSRSR